MNHSASDSVSAWISDLKAGDERAANLLWQLYFEKLVRIARQRLPVASRRAADEEDAALSAFKSLCLGAKRGHFEKLTNRDDLWALLLTITQRKCVRQFRRQQRQKRGGGKVRGESVFLRQGDSCGAAGINEVLGEEPTPEFVAILNEEHGRLLDRLRDDTLRQVAIYRLEGYGSEEIAKELRVTTRTVRRKLAVIRTEWEGELRS